MLTILASDTSFEPSDDEGSRRRRRHLEPLVWDGVTRQEKNRVVREFRTLIVENHRTYLSLKGSPYEWQEMLDTLEVFGPNKWLSEKVICRFLMDHWWPLRYGSETGLVYLPFAILQELSTGICRRGQTDRQNAPDFVDGPFYRQYSSVIPQISRRRVGFILIRNVGSMSAADFSWRDVLQRPNHFFPVVFDYDSRIAYAFGAFGGSRPGIRHQGGTESDWDRWYGPELWMELAHLLGWSGVLCPTDEMQVVSKEWSQVRLHGSHVCSLVAHSRLSPEWIRLWNVLDRHHGKVDFWNRNRGSTGHNNTNRVPPLPTCGTEDATPLDDGGDSPVSRVL